MDFSANLEECTIFSKIDLHHGFHQIPIRAEDQKKTAIITPFGLFEYTRMPFGLRNSAQAFQRLMDSIMQGLPWCFVYIHDILIGSKNPEEHKIHLRQAFERLESNGMGVNFKKCVFGVAEIEFLGHLVTKDGIRPLPSKVEAISEYPRPQ